MGTVTFGSNPQPDISIPISGRRDDAAAPQQAWKWMSLRVACYKIMQVIYRRAAAHQLMHVSRERLTTFANNSACATTHQTALQALCFTEARQQCMLDPVTPRNPHALPSVEPQETDATGPNRQHSWHTQATHIKDVQGLPAVLGDSSGNQASAESCTGALRKHESHQRF